MEQKTNSIEPIVKIFRKNIDILPAMNLYRPSKEFILIGTLSYVVLWSVLFIWFIKSSSKKNKFIPPLISLIFGTLFLYLEYELCFSEYSYVLMPNRKVYKLFSPIKSDGQDTWSYQVITSGNIGNSINSGNNDGYIIPLSTYNEMLDFGTINAEPLPKYLENIRKKTSNLEARNLNFPQIEDGYTSEMNSLSAAAYYLCITMITWISYTFYTTKKVPHDTLILTIISIIFAISSSISTIDPRSVSELSKKVLIRRLGIHIATAFAAGALASGFIN
jgi:hypothetical protein